jgi:hypothetical protein
MIRILRLALIGFLITGVARAQTAIVKGNVRDRNEKTPISGATVKIQSLVDSLSVVNLVTDQKGHFQTSELYSQSYRIKITSVGFQPLDTIVRLDTVIDFHTIYLDKEAKLLSEVIFQGAAPPVRQRADTLEYSASAFKVNPDANADDLVKKMPGITVENGTVKAGGEDVKKVTIDGREFFGDDATAALRNLPAEVIDKIQVFDRLSDQAQFTGFEDNGTVKAINIVTKANMRNGQFGRVFAGYGTDDRYSVGGNVSFFNGNRRISLVGLTNNINQQNFATEDLLGVTSTGGRGGSGANRGGGRGGRGNQGGGGGNRGFGSSGNFLVGQQGGISKTNSFGINFSDLWSKKFEVTGSYFFNNSNNTNNQLVNRQYFLTGDSTQDYDESTLSSSNNYNHRVNLRLQYKIDSANILIMTPSLSLQKNDSRSLVDGQNSYTGSDLISRSINENTRQSSGYNFNNNILFRHAFPKRGRTVSINVTTGLTNRDGSTYLNALNRYFKGGPNVDDSLRQFSDQFSNGFQVSTNIAYTEPLGKKGQLQFNYNPSYSKTDADQTTYHFDDGTGKYSFFDTSLSNKFNNIYNTQNGGVSYRIGDRDKMFSIGASYQYATLSSDQDFPYDATIKRSFTNILPNAMLRAKLSSKSNIRLFYRSSTTPPSISQLQNVINNTNPLFLTTGNPNLDQSFTHNISGRYTYTNTAKSQSFLANIFVQKTNDYVANASFIASQDSVLTPTVTLFKGSQLTKPVNLDGYWSVRSFFTFAMPVKFIKSNLNWNVGYTYIQTPGMIDNVINISKTSNYNVGAVLASNISEYVDFNLSYTANFNIVKNSIQPQLNNNYFNQVAGFQINLLTKNGWVLQNDLNNQSYKGLTDGYNQSFWLWNMSLGKKFLAGQKGELRLSVFDLLNQNKSIERNATETYVEDVQTQVLRQYFMLTFSYRLRNFGSGNKKGH